ncbi:hypothetical protein [Ilumatobacter sp.]|uniref:hypothetical protein n=1 Tax=Ilumatobacter sp. TaxID=1967498 RepID=UPI0037526531
MNFKEKDPRDSMVQLNTPIPFHLKSDLTAIAILREQSLSSLIRECIEDNLSLELSESRRERRVEDEILAVHRAKLETSGAGATR